jgi:septum formation protein
MMSKIVLASASPRRSELLAAADIPFEVIPANLEERQGQQEPAEAFVRRIAAEKARQVLAGLPCDTPQIVLGADTVVVAGDQTLGKPASAEEAAHMLRSLSGKEHLVMTAVCLLRRPASPAGRLLPATEEIRTAVTTVRFAPLSDSEIQEYVATGEPFDKAGAYAIQGSASRFVEWIDGCYFNVVGLPVSLVYRMLQRGRDASIGG